MAVLPTPPPGPGVSGFGEASSRRNWMGIASLILGLTCLGFLGVVFGHLGLRAAKRGEADNRGLAIAGLSVSYVQVAAFVAFIAWAPYLDSAPPANGQGNSGLGPAAQYVPESAVPAFTPSAAPSQTTPPRTVDVGVQVSAPWFEIRVGECIADYHDVVGVDGDSLVFDHFDVVDCGQPHYAEIYAIGEVGGDQAPANYGEWASIAKACVAEPFVRYVGVPFTESALSYDWLYPADAWWDSGNRQFLCMVIDEEADAVGSVRAPRP